MQVLNIIFTIIALVTNFALTFFAVSAWFTLRRQEKRLRAIELVVTHTDMLATAEHLRSMFNELNDMRQTLNRLIDDERFEDAERMKQLLDTAEKYTMKSVNNFKEHFGSDVVKFECFTDSEEGGCE